MTSSTNNERRYPAAAVADANNKFGFAENSNGNSNMMQMSDDFYKDDYYDYKRTFGQDESERRMDEFQEDDYYEEDDNNDFQTGPLALKTNHNQTTTTTTTTNTNNRMSTLENVDEEEIVEDYDHQHEHEHYDDHNQFYPSNGEMFDEVEQDDLLMMDTFFKRVDSQELVKPKKAKIISNYLIGELLGDGSYGKVKECLDIRDLSRCAVKIINLKMISRKIPRGVENVQKEISIMRRLNHKNIIHLYDTFEKGPTSAIQSSYNYNNNINNIRNKQVLPNEPGTSLFKNNINNNNNNNVNNNETEVNHQHLELQLPPTTMINLEKPPKIYIFMDYCMTSMEKLFKNAPDQRLRNWQANYYFKQLLDGLEYLHSLNIIHNDIKPGNLLITCDNILKICDFSISAELKVFHEHEFIANANDNSDSCKYADSSRTRFDDDDNNNYDNTNDHDDKYNDCKINPDLLTNTSPSRFPIIQCTPMFQCPEMLAENMDELLILKHAPKIDIWSSGITLYQLTTGQLPFQGTTVHQIYENIRSNTIKIPDYIDKNLSTLLMAMLDKDPVSRWSIKQIRDCEWFRKKHPLVKEELAVLPADVAQNETSTFRMLQFLQKLCQQKDESLDPQVADLLNKNSKLISLRLQQQEEVEEEMAMPDDNDETRASSSNTTNNNNNKFGTKINRLKKYLLNNIFKKN